MDFQFQTRYCVEYDGKVIWNDTRVGISKKIVIASYFRSKKTPK
jgi:hypothetical protein